jgi:hypothetical protein
MTAHKGSLLGGYIAGLLLAIDALETFPNLRFRTLRCTWGFPLLSTAVCGTATELGFLLAAVTKATVIIHTIAKSARLHISSRTY